MESCYISYIAVIGKKKDLLRSLLHELLTRVGIVKLTFQIRKITINLRTVFFCFPLVLVINETKMCISLRLRV